MNSVDVVAKKEILSFSLFGFGAIFSQVDSQYIRFELLLSLEYWIKFSVELQIVLGIVEIDKRKNVSI